MNKIGLFTFLFLSVLLISQASAVCTISPDTWSAGTINPGSSHEKIFTIDAQGSTCSIGTDSEYITFTETSFTNITSSFKAVLSVPGNAAHQSYTQHVKVNDVSVVSITYTVSSAATGRLEPTFSWTKKQFEQGVEATQILNLRNKYASEIEITHIGMEGDVIATREGITKPVYIKEGKAGFLQSGSDTSITIGFNTKDIRPDDYSTKIIVTYYHEGERHTLEISLEVSVLVSFEAREEIPLGDLKIIVNPTEPQPEDYVAFILQDSSTNQNVGGEMWIYVYTDSTLKTSFKYANPFEVESGHRYVVNASATGYNPSEVAFSIGLEMTRINIYPENPEAGSQVEFTYVDSSGHTVEGAKLLVNDKEQSNPFKTEVVEGTYVIKAEKDGYEAAQTSLIVRKPLEIVAIPDAGMVGETLSIQFGEAEEYKILKGNEIKLTGISKNITFTAEYPGNYTVFARGKNIGVIEVHQGWTWPEINTGGIWNWIILIIIVLVILFFIYPGWLRKRKKSKFKNIKVSPSRSGPLTTEKY